MKGKVDNKIKIINKSSGEVITQNAEIADSFFSRFKGLMLSSEKRDLLLVFPIEDISRAAIHMFFMNFPLDIIWINSKMRIVDIKKEVPPLKFLNPKTWKIYKPRKKAKFALELSSGKIGKRTKIGDEVEFLPSNIAHTKSLH